MEEFTENALSFGHCPNNPPPFPLRASWANLSILEKVLNQNRSKSIWAAPPPSPCMPIWATFAFSFTKVSESVWAGGPPNMGNAQKKECFCLGSHPLVNGPISWGSTQTSYTCHGHRPCLGDIPFHKAPSFCKWQASPSFRWSHMFGPGHEYSFVGKWTKFFCAIQWSPIPSLTSLSRSNLVGARQHWDKMHSSCDPDSTKFIMLPQPSPQTWF